MNITEFRAKYPEYGDMSDAELSDALYRKHYSDIPRADFDAKFLVATPGATPAAAPQEPGVLDRLRSSLSQAYGDSMTGAKAAAQGIPGVGTWTDELAGQIMSRLRGGTPEENRKAYMAPVEAMPAGRRTLAELIGGGVGGVGLALAAPATVGFIPGVLAGTALGAAQGAGANQEDRLGGATGGAVVGGIGGVIAPVIAKGVATGAAGLGNLVNRAIGRPANPFLGKGGANAHAALRNSLGRAAKRGAPPVTTESPLLAQPAGATAAKRVLGMGGDAAAELSGAAKRVMADKSAIQAAGDQYNTTLGLTKLSRATKPAQLLEAPSLKSPVFDELSNNPYVKTILRKLSKDPRFYGVPEDNLNARHYVKTMLSAKERALTKAAKDPQGAEAYGALHDAWTKALDDAQPGYSDVAAAYRVAAQKRAAEVESAKLAGGATKFTPQDAGSMSLSERGLGGVPPSPHGAALNLAAALAEKLGLSSRRATMEKISKVLAETDPAKIDMAIKMLRRDMTGKGLRPLLTMQGDNIARAAARR